jgi:hypothetical protein
MRMADSLNELNSPSDPTGDFLVSVVWRISGKKREANQRNGKQGAHEYGANR